MLQLVREWQKRVMDLERKVGTGEGSLAPWYARLAGFPCNACKL